MIKHLSSFRHKKSNELKKFAEEEIQLSAISQIKVETNNNKPKKISTSICINEAKLHLKLLVFWANNVFLTVQVNLVFCYFQYHFLIKLLNL